MVQNAENNETKEVMNQDIREDTCGEELMQCKTNTQNDPGLVENIDPAQGRTKRPHESSDSNKKQPTIELYAQKH